MGNMKTNLIKKVAKTCIKVGEVGAIDFSIPSIWYEPKVPESLLKVKENKNL